MLSQGETDACVVVVFRLENKGLDPSIAIVPR